MGDRRIVNRFAVPAFVGRLLRRRPHDAVAAMVAGVATAAIVVNALWFQSGTHPAPAAVANGKGAAATNAAAPAPSRKVVAMQRALADFGYGQLAPTGIADPATKAAIERFERERKLPITGQVSDRLMRELAAMTARPLE